MSYRTIKLLLFLIFFQFSGIVNGQNSDLLIKAQQEVDSIMNNAINHQAFPGAVVFASWGDSVLLNKAYGYHTYDSLREVQHDDLFDLASVTKVMGAGLALMKLYEDSLIILDQPLSRYIKGLRFNKIGKITIREFLGHQSGLPAWIPYYQYLQKKNGNYKNKSLSVKRKSGYSYEIKDNLYIYDQFDERIKKFIKKSKVDKNPSYRYSGLFFYLVPEMVRNLTGMGLREYLDASFYSPLGVESILFNPTDKFALEQIIPTEIDSFFRFSPIHGRVHDEGAILMGGVSGNSGLFGNAADVSKVWRMLLNYGVYDETQYLKPSTIQLFTSYQYPQLGNRRGLTFDKPLLDYDSLISSVAESASILSYGHSGYTGTLIWADPKYDLLFIFLSNRVYPSRNQTAIYDLNVRPSIHQILYNLID